MLQSVGGRAAEKHAQLDKLCFRTVDVGQGADGGDGVQHRHRAHVENRIHASKDTGLRNPPCEDLVRNQAWLQLVLIAQDLHASGHSSRVSTGARRRRSEKLRRHVWHAAAVIARTGRQTIVRFQRSWPWTTDIVIAVQRQATYRPPGWRPQPAPQRHHLHPPRPHVCRRHRIHRREHATSHRHRSYQRRICSPRQPPIGAATQLPMERVRASLHSHVVRRTSRLPRPGLRRPSSVDASCGCRIRRGRL